MLLSILRKAIIKCSPDHLISSVLLGAPLQTLKGTIRKETDYDDAWFYALARNSRVVFDIGCNHGYTAILGLIANPRNQMLLVDANPLAMAKAVKNLAINNLINNCRMFIGFLSNKPDENVIFYTVGSGAAGSMFKTHAKTAGSINSRINAQTSTIDNLCEMYKMNPDFIKIDVEGAESLVLEGSIKTALLKECRFLVEMHSSPELSMVENASKVLTWCANNDYTAWYLKEKTILLDVDMISHRGKCHLLLQPRGWSFPDFLISISQSDPLPLKVNQ